jgi:uncharacterized protein YaaQ
MDKCKLNYKKTSICGKIIDGKLFYLRVAIVMKLIIAIVQGEDSTDFIEALAEENYRVTKLATTGGFLKSGNTTLMVGIEEEKVQAVIDVIKQICKKRKETLVTPTTLGGSEGGYMQQYPVQINVGGATIFVIDVDQFVKI